MSVKYMVLSLSKVVVISISYSATTVRNTKKVVNYHPSPVKFILWLCFTLKSKYWVQLAVLKYRWTTLYARDRDSKNRLAYDEFAYKKT